MQQQIIVNEREGGILVIQINRSEKKNAVNNKTARLLLKHIQDFEKSSNKVAVLYGGNDFCVGFDLAQTISQDTIKQWSPNSYGRGPMGPTRLFPSKPIIAAVTGYCVAGGLQLALWCDMIISHQQASFGVFCRRVGVPLIDGGTIKLSSIIGLNRARDMILTGRQIKGQQAFNWGLVNRLVPKDKVLQQSISLALQISQHPQITMLSDRRSLYQSTFGKINDKLYRQFQLGFNSLKQGGAKEGVSNFFKRTPKL